MKILLEKNCMNLLTQKVIAGKFKIELEDLKQMYRGGGGQMQCRKYIKSFPLQSFLLKKMAHG
jgi:hypothetical protein